MTASICDGGLPAPLQGLEVAQVGILVPDLHAGISRYRRLGGLDAWAVYTYGPDNVDDLTYRGEPGCFSMRLAFASHGPQIELIEVLGGPSIYDEWIEEHGYGMHHLGFRVPSIAEATRTMEDAGCPPIQSGRGYGASGDGGFAYFDTTSSLALISELIEVPSVRRPSETLAT